MNNYRPFKSMRELTEIVYSKDWKYRDNLSVGNCLTIRHKGDKHFHQKILITSLVYNKYYLISMNDKPMQEWLDNFEFLAHCEWHSFGVQKKMIRLKTIVEIIYDCERKDMSKEFQEMSLADFKNYCLKNKSSPLKEELKSCLGDECKINIKSVEVTEE